MARQRINKGFLEFSTNRLRCIRAKRLIIEVRSKGWNLSHAFTILGVKKEEHGTNIT